MTIRKTPLLASDRVSIVMTLVPYLIEKGPVPVAQAAADFEVSPEVMRAMAEGLTLIGLPNGMDNDLFGIDWDLLDEHDELALDLDHIVAFERAPRLTSREAAALLAGLQLAQALPGVASRGVVSGLIAKLARGAGATPAELVLTADPVDGVRTAVMDALDRGVAVSFTYRRLDAKSSTTRTVDPVRVLINDAQWYLRGWCHMREDIRTFHLDRVSDLVVTDIPSGQHDDPQTQVFSGEGGALAIRVTYPTVLTPLLGQYLDSAEIEEGPERSSATLRVADEQALKRLAARRGGAVVIEEPEAARAAAVEWAEAGLARYA
ncbi:MAG TPA: WYL domain-containing protein [Microbacterium sp.]|uniref:helix-turn-helix transcriptional regulator n=1 Tax=Microbacterium sp. TaxID=51671 RepID=UPI002C3B32BE|nr:WYL domain-containing protein [Microbacterium sp.]HWI32436.1 WYL domain-containing protein [Microbacterium sp.]